MTYPPAPGGYGQQPDPYGQQGQPGYGHQPGYGQQQPGYDPAQAPPMYGQPDPYGQPVTGVPASPAYGTPVTGVPASPAYGQPGYGQPAYGVPGGMAPIQAPGERPQKVTLGAMLTLGTGAVALMSSIAGFVGMSVMENRIAQAESLLSTSTDTGFGATYIVNGIFNVLWLIGFTVIALFLLRGFNGARIAAFIVHGLNIACAGFGLLWLVGLTALITAINDELASSGNSAYDILPAWFLPISIMLSILQLAFPIVAIILLANRESGQWFAANTQARAAGLI